LGGARDAEVCSIERCAESVGGGTLSFVTPASGLTKLTVSVNTDTAITRETISASIFTDPTLTAELTYTCGA
jgi:hypothetical protein